MHFTYRVQSQLDLNEQRNEMYLASPFRNKVILIQLFSTSACPADRVPEGNYPSCLGVKVGLHPGKDASGPHEAK